jgi:hypothetical protein
MPKKFYEMDSWKVENKVVSKLGVFFDVVAKYVFSCKYIILALYNILNKVVTSRGEHL